MPTLLWFRRDLRLHDLPALLDAITDTDEVLACFVLDPRLEASSGTRRMQYLCNSLQHLQDGLDGRLLVTRSDIREEIERLRAHLDQARDLLHEGGAVGRRLDFLCQELNREANTLCSKSADIELTRIGMALKAAVEQFREQVQNIE